MLAALGYHLEVHAVDRCNAPHDEAVANLDLAGIAPHHGAGGGLKLQYQLAGHAAGEGSVDGLGVTHRLGGHREQLAGAAEEHGGRHLDLEGTLDGGGTEAAGVVGGDERRQPQARLPILGQREADLGLVSSPPPAPSRRLAARGRVGEVSLGARMASVAATQPARAERQIDIGKVVENAVTFNLTNSPDATLNAGSLPATVDHLFALLEERRVDYLLVGGIALLLYVEGRNTDDLDLIVALSSLEALPELVIDEQDADFARGRYEGLRLDLLLTTNPVFEKVRARYCTVRQVAGREVRCATVEGLVLLKLYALPSLYRQGNFARVGLYENDLATLLEAYRPRLDPLLAELEAHLLPTDLAAVRKVLAEIEERIARFERGTAGG